MAPANNDWNKYYMVIYLLWYYMISPVNLIRTWISIIVMMRANKRGFGWNNKLHCYHDWLPGRCCKMCCRQALHSISTLRCLTLSVVWTAFSSPVLLLLLLLLLPLDADTSILAANSLKMSCTSASALPSTAAITYISIRVRLNAVLSQRITCTHKVYFLFWWSTLYSRDCTHKQMPA